MLKVSVGVVLAAAVAAAALATLGGCRKRVAYDLVVITPHNERIEREFELAFSAWHKEKFGKEIRIQWLKPGGGSTATQQLINQYANADTSGIDICFGSGAPDHMLLASKGILVPVELPPETLAQLPVEINGIRQYDPQHRWYGTVVSCFGILYNKKLLEQYKIPPPRIWDDLASPALFGRLCAADAAQSSSARAAYELIIQSAASRDGRTPDWPAGWGRLLKLFANCNRFTAGASDVPPMIANGQVLAGLAIDQYAYMQMTTPGGDDLGFALVPGSTAFTPDPISLLKGAPHEQTARRFIEFVLSERGQALFCLPIGVPNGPVEHALYRQPIRRDLYEKYAGKMLPQLVHPFVQTQPLVYDVEAADIRMGLLLGPLMKAAVLDSREQLVQAWKAILDAGLPEALVNEFVALPDDLADRQTALETARGLASHEQREAATSAWQRYFRDKYNRIIRQAGK